MPTPASRLTPDDAECYLLTLADVLRERVNRAESDCLVTLTQHEAWRMSERLRECWEVLR